MVRMPTRADLKLKTEIIEATVHREVEGLRLEMA